MSKWRPTKKKNNNRNVVSLTRKKRILDQIAKQIIMTISHVNDSEKNMEMLLMQYEIQNCS